MYFDFQGHYDDVRIDLMSKWGMKSYLRLILYLNMEKNWQSLFTSMDFLWACFCPYMLCNTKIARTDGYLERTLIPFCDKELNMVSNCSEKYEEYSVISFCLGIIFRIGRDERKRAKMRVLTWFFMKCL